MRIRLIAPAAIIATLTLSACSDSPLSPIDPLANSAAARGSSSTSTSTARVRLIASLTPPADGPYRNAKGKAQWDTRDGNTKRELEMEVEHIPAGTAVEFFVDGVKVGGATTDALGEAEVSFSTQLGESVPMAAAGLSAEVRTAAGVVIVSGVFPAT
ncbi:MAG: hypothetical protein OEW77_06395 [Gemmatimonadota bacterium]|nr:hypothetical protein [Gemmatimonadota bacterium]